MKKVSLLMFVLGLSFCVFSQDTITNTSTNFTTLTGASFGNPFITSGTANWCTSFGYHGLPFVKSLLGFSQTINGITSVNSFTESYMDQQTNVVRKSEDNKGLIAFQIDGASRLMMNRDGVVKIGIAFSTDYQEATGDMNGFTIHPYRLYVEGGIRTEELKIDLKYNWADYVFKPTYNLIPLFEVEAIKRALTKYSIGRNGKGRRLKRKRNAYPTNGENRRVDTVHDFNQQRKRSHTRT